MTRVEMMEKLIDIAGALMHEADIADRPGQMDRLMEMSADLRAVAYVLTQPEVVDART